MRLISCRKGGVTGVDFSATWRIQVAAVPSAGGAGAALGLVYRYQPASPIISTVNPQMPLMGVGEYAQLVLAAADVDPAENVAALKPVADVALLAGERDADVARLAEGLNLFRNLPRVRAETLEAMLRDCTAILDGYWQIRNWLAAGAQERLELTVVDAKILGVP